MSESILSGNVDSFGYRSGRLQCGRQLNVRLESTLGLEQPPVWCAYIGGKPIARASSEFEVETLAVAWAATNPANDDSDGDFGASAFDMG